MLEFNIKGLFDNIDHELLKAVRKHTTEKWISFHPAKTNVIAPQSAYGKTIYITPKWDLCLFTKIPHGSKLWKEKMNSGTSIERLNNRILNHYGG